MALVKITQPRTPDTETEYKRELKKPALLAQETLAAMKEANEIAALRRYGSFRELRERSTARD